MLSVHRSPVRCGDDVLDPTVTYYTTHCTLYNNLPIVFLSFRSFTFLCCPFCIYWCILCIRTLRHIPVSFFFLSRVVVLRLVFPIMGTSFSSLSLFLFFFSFSRIETWWLHMKGIFSEWLRGQGGDNIKFNVWQVFLLNNGRGIKYEKTIESFVCKQSRLLSARKRSK